MRAVRSLLASCGMAIAFSGFAVDVARAVSYHIEALPNLPGSTDAYTGGINNLGQAVGHNVGADGKSHAVLWNATGAHELAYLSATNNYSEAYRINDAGQIVGLARNDANFGRGAYWDADGVLDMGALGGAYSFANDINEAGVAVGSAASGNTGSRAFSWTKSGGIVDLGNFNPTDSQQYAGYNGINNKGLMVGTAYRLFSPYRPTMAQPGAKGPSDIGLPGRVAGMAMAVNDDGTIVGWHDGPNGTGGPAIFNGDGTVQFIGNFGLGDGQALDINSAGQIVGFAVGFDDVGQVNKAFVYDHGLMTDLMTAIDDPSWTTTFEATGINDKGQILGVGVHNNEIAAFVLTPVPEPATIALLALATMTLPFRRRR
jgi:probable HAF family extracellular repeat protein